MEMQHGNLSINSENIFPIIKKWMYSDQDIFIRELVSNAADAITKLKKLDAIGEYQLPDDYKPAIRVVVDDKEKTLQFIDNGLGMTADEVKKNITDIAFSGAAEFLEKYKDKADADQIIGHFGLGFYSAFMVADQVDIDTLSFTEGATPVHWECDGSTEYDMGEGEASAVGTVVTLHLNEESLAYANEYKIRDILEKYCSFMPVPIYLEKAGSEQEYEVIDEADLREGEEVIERISTPAKTEEMENEDGTKEVVETAPAKEEVKIKKRPVPVNETQPLWTKRPGECTEEEYKEFYRHVFLDYKEPLFWIHLNMDYPFNLKGILYFPRIQNEYDSIEGKIKLYNNQVFIADNIKEVIPEYLLLLKGVIDCPDLPLNVSRSALQNDGFVQKISSYISKKVADKLSGMCKNKREQFEGYWEDISPFIKFGCIRDEKFAEKMQDSILYKNLDDKYLTLQDLIDREKAAEADAEKASQTDNAENAAEASQDVNEENAAEAAEDAKEITIYYVTDPQQQSQYINLFRAQGMDAVVLRHNIDSTFISHLEQKNPNLHFRRIDAEVNSEVKEEASLDKEQTSLEDSFRKALGNESLAVQATQLKDESVAALFTISEENRRMSEMMKMYGMGGNEDLFAAQSTLVLNVKHPLVAYLLAHPEDDNEILCKQLYDLALLGSRPLTSEEMTAFVQRSNELMLKIYAK